MNITTSGQRGLRFSRIALGTWQPISPLTELDLDEIDKIVTDATPVAGPSPEDRP